MGVAATPAPWGLKTQPKSWPTLGSFWAICYLKIVFSSFQTLNPPKNEVLLYKKWLFYTMIKKYLNEWKLNCNLAQQEFKKIIDWL